MTLEEPIQSGNRFKRVFFSPEEPRLRAGWRLLLHLILILMFLIPPSMVAALIFILTGGVYLLSTLSPILLLANSIVLLFATLPATYLARRFLDRRSFRSLGFTWDRHSLRDLGIGFLLPGGLMGFIYFIERVMGWVSFEGWGWEFDPPLETLGWILLYLFLFMATGFYEELVSRGYQLQNLRDGINLPAAFILSSAVFGVAHISNPNGTLAAGGMIIFAGLFFALSWYRTQALWLPIGLHIGWNFFEGPIFGFPVSGNPTISLLRLTDTGPEWITGGAFGPEAGILILPALLAASVFVWFYTESRAPGPPAVISASDE